MISARSANSGVLLIWAAIAPRAWQFRRPGPSRCGHAPSEPVPARMLALALQPYLEVNQSFARFHQRRQLLARGIVRLSRRFAECLGEPGDHLRVDRDRSSPAARPTARSGEPAWGRRSAPRCRPDAAPWPSHAHSRRSPPSPPCSPCACAARRPACGDLAAVLGNVCATTASRMHASTLSLATSMPTTTDHLVPSSSSLPCSSGLEALATVRVEEDTGAVPRSPAGSVAFGRHGLSSSDGRLVTTARSHILPNFRTQGHERIIRRIFRPGEGAPHSANSVLAATPSPGIIQD